MSEERDATCPLHEATARALVDLGVDTLFGLIGDANLFMVQRFRESAHGRFVPAAHEAGAVLMAIGYSLVSGRPGVVSVTHGPGLTNTLTALVEAVKARVPLLFLCGDTPVTEREHFQHVDQREFVLAAGAGFEQLRSPATLLEDLTRALRRALLERRPVALNMPADFEWEPLGYRPPRLLLPDPPAAPRAGSALDDAVGILASARSPVILAGRGALAPAAETALAALAERAGALLATTLKGKGLFRDDPFNLGVFGTLSTAVANDLILESDCVIAFGASLNKWTSGRGSLLSGKRVVQCNQDPASLGAHWLPDAALAGDPAQIAAEIVYWLDEAEIPARAFRSEENRARIAACDPFAELPDTATATTVDLTRALLRIGEALPADRVYVTDVGRFVGQAWQAIDVARPGAFLHTVHFGSIGLGLGYALGAAVASPERPALLVTGDGGFMLGGLTEFHTAVREQLDVVVVVCNDGGYGAEYVQYEARGRDPAPSLFAWPSFAAVAEALGGSGVTVHDEASLARACAAIAERTGPLLVDLRLDPATMIPLDY